MLANHEMMVAVLVQDAHTLLTNPDTFGIAWLSDLELLQKDVTWQFGYAL